MLLWQRGRLARLTGDTQEHAACVEQLRRTYAGTPQLDLIGRLFGLAERLYAAPCDVPDDFAASDAATALRLGDCTALLPLAQWAFCRGDTGLAEALGERLDALGHSHTGSGVMTMVWDGPLDLGRALAAACRGDVARAEADFQRAFALALEHGGEPAAVRIALWWTRAFDRAEASSMRVDLVRRAAEHALQLAGEPTVRQALEAWQARHARSVPVPSPSGLPPAFDLTRDGEQYRLRVGELDVALRDTKGVRWLATLLAEPGRAFHVLTLSSEGEPMPVDTGDAGTLLDAQAVEAYRARVRALEEEREEAAARGDLGRLERIVEEQEALHAQLASAVGSGGRLRRDKSASERARVNVQRRLKDAICRVGEIDAAVGRHLERSVRTGIYCVYDPA